MKTFLSLAAAALALGLTAVKVTRPVDTATSQAVTQALAVRGLRD